MRTPRERKVAVKRVQTVTKKAESADSMTPCQLRHLGSSAHARQKRRPARQRPGQVGRGPAADRRDQRPGVPRGGPTPAARPADGPADRRPEAAGQAAGVPVVYVNDNFGRWRSDFNAQVEHCLQDGVRGKPVVELLRPEEDDYFVLKPKHSGFFSTTLDTLLEYLGSEGRRPDRHGGEHLRPVHGQRRLHAGLPIHLTKPDKTNRHGKERVGWCTKCVFTAPMKKEGKEDLRRGGGGKGEKQLRLRFLRRGDRPAHRPVGGVGAGVRRGLPGLLPPKRHPRRD